MSEPDAVVASSDHELTVVVFDDTWDAWTCERVTNVMMADNGMLILQGNAVIQQTDVNTVLAAYAQGCWKMWKLDTADVTD
jgi:hypothetical protein